MELNKELAKIEAVLFACGDPLPAEKLADACGIQGDTELYITALNNRYEETGGALHILRLGGCYQLASKKEFAPYVKAALETKRDTPLSNAALEVLAIAAYNEPVTKSFIENIRGVDSSSIVNSLVEKDLLEEAGRLDVPGRPIIFRTTRNFLRCFEMSSLEDLPPVSQLSIENNEVSSQK